MQYTIVLHGNDATGKTTLCRALNDCGHLCFTRGDSDDAHDINLKVIDKLTLEIPNDVRQALPASYVDPSGTERRIFRFILDADIRALQGRIATRPQSDKWESEKALFYFRARFTELAAFYGLPLIRTDLLGSVESTVEHILSFVRRPEIFDLLQAVSLRQLTPERIVELAALNVRHEGIDYEGRLPQILAETCPETSLFTKDDVLEQCDRDPNFIHTIVNSYDHILPRAPYSFRLVVEGESKQVYSLETEITDYFRDKLFVFLKPTIYSHSRQSTAEIENLSSIRAQGARLFLEMFHRAGVRHTYEGINRHGLVLVGSVEITPIETIYKAFCEGTDKHSFYGMRSSPEECLETGEYRGGPYVRFDWRNPNHTYQGVDARSHPLYHLMEASVGKEEFYRKFLTGRAVPFGDKCVPQELVPLVQDIERSQITTLKVYLTIQYYLQQIDLEVQDGCIMVDREGENVWSEVDQDCMRIKRRNPTAENAEAFDKDVWRAGGSSAKDKIKVKWTQLNGLLESYFADHPFHTNEMVSSLEPYGSVSKAILEDTRFVMSPMYKALYTRLATHTRLPRPTPAEYLIGITCSKYTDRTDTFIEAHLGIRIQRPTGRSLVIHHDVVDRQKYEVHFGSRNVKFLPMKPKDIPQSISSGMVDFAVTYNVVVENYPKTSTLVVSVPDEDLVVALIARQGQVVDPTQWSTSGPMKVLAEHPGLVKEFFDREGVAQGTYTLDTVCGSSESYLVNDSRETYVLCDAVVSTGKTLAENALEVWKLVKGKGEVTIGLYKAL